jgi:hypothetical protein
MPHKIRLRRKAAITGRYDTANANAQQSVDMTVVARR